MRRVLRVLLAEARDELWRAFWKRQAKYLPPKIVIANNVIHGVPGSNAPALQVDTGTSFTDEARVKVSPNCVKRWDGAA